MKKAEDFRNKGSHIFKDKPNGIGAFLDESPLRSENTQIHIPTKTQIKRSELKSGGLGRLHVEIKQCLIDKLIESVYKRKTDPKIKKKKATQRAIIEESLELFFNKMA